MPAERRRIAKTRSITLEGVTTNNLKNVTVQFPLSVFVCVTGVSGSGKSSLVERNARPGAGAKAGRPRAEARPASRACAARARSTRSSRSINRRSAARRGAIRPRTPACSTKSARSSPPRATPSSAATRPGRFSFNVKGGRCEECQGQGQQKIEMNFLPDLYVPCPVCEGKRFNRQTLEIRYKDRSIADVLDMRIDEAAVFFENFPVLARLLELLAGSRPGLHDARAVVEHALRRRGAAHQAGRRTQPRRYRQNALHPRRTDHRPALRRHQKTARRARAAWSIWATR